MEQMNNECFDLPALFKLNDLNARSFAEAKPSLPVNEYFGKLSEFLSLAPDVSRALGKFDNREGDIDDRRSVNSMINILENIGCTKFIVDFHSILDSYENEGNWRLAATYARRVRDDFNDFYSQVLSTKNKNGEAAAVDGTLSLTEVIRLFDEENASRKPLILAVDDSPVILRSLSSVLSGEYKVITLPKPLEIVNVLKNQKPDLFLLDYMMPEMDGFELIPIIRSFEEHKKTPIIFLTSDGTVDNLTSAIAMGARDFIVKPFDPEILKEKIGKHILKS